MQAAVDLQHPLREFRVEWGTLCSRESDGTGLYIGGYFRNRFYDPDPWISSYLVKHKISSWWHQILLTRGENSYKVIALNFPCTKILYIDLPPLPLWSSPSAIGEKAMATHSCVLAWRIPGTGEPGGLPSMGSQSRTRMKRLSSSSSSSSAELPPPGHLILPQINMQLSTCTSLEDKCIFCVPIRKI